MYLKMRRENLHSYTEMCFLCGQPFTLGDIAFELYDAAECLGFLCDECIDLDRSAQADRLCEHAVWLRQQATWLEEIADEGLPHLSRADTEAWAEWKRERDLPPIDDDALPF